MSFADDVRSVSIAEQEPSDAGMIRRGDCLAQTFNDLEVEFLVDPVVGTGGRFFAVLVDVDLEALAIAAVLPVGDGVTHVVEERTAAEINIANKHSAEMADVADVIATESECEDEFHCSHGNHISAHAHFHWNRKHHYLAIRKKNGAGEQHTEDCAGGADCRNVSGWLAPK